MTSENLPQLPPPPSKDTSIRMPRLWPLWLLSLVILIAVAVLAWTGWQQMQMRKQSLDALQSSTYQQQVRLNELENRYQERLGTLDRKLEDTDKSVQRFDKQLTYNAQQLLSMGAKGRTDWLLAEAEYLLRLANQRLRMERDPTGALAILQAADQVLAETDDIAVYAVRQAIAQEVLALQSVKQLDRTGLFLQLDALGQAVDKLQQRLGDNAVPKASADAPQANAADATAPSAWRRALAELWQQLKQLVVIRRLDHPVEPLLPPDNLFFLQQNLHLLLEQAQLALVQKNQPLYDASLAKADAWVRQYFEQNNASTQAVLDNLGQLQKVKVDPQLPDISTSLRLLKDLLSQVYSQHRLPATNATTNDSPAPAAEPAAPVATPDGGSAP